MIKHYIIISFVVIINFSFCTSEQKTFLSKPVAHILAQKHPDTDYVKNQFMAIPEKQVQNDITIFNNLQSSLFQMKMSPYQVAEILVNPDDSEDILKKYNVSKEEFSLSLKTIMENPILSNKLKDGEDYFKRIKNASIKKNTYSKSQYIGKKIFRADVITELPDSNSKNQRHKGIINKNKIELPEGKRNFTNSQLFSRQKNLLLSRKINENEVNSEQYSERTIPMKDFQYQSTEKVKAKTDR